MGKHTVTFRLVKCPICGIEVKSRGLHAHLRLVHPNSDIKKEAFKFSEIDKEGQRWSAKNYKGGYTSYGSISSLHKISSTFEDLEKEINKHTIIARDCSPLFTHTNCYILLQN